MVWQDELNNAKKVLKSGNPKQIWSYFLGYYKWHVIILVFVLAFLGSIIYTSVTAKECVLGGVFLNSNIAEDKVTELQQDISDRLCVDTKKEEVRLSANHYFSNDTGSLSVSVSYETLQLVSAKIAAGEIDFMVGDVASMNNFAYWGYFCDLTQVLSEEMVEQYEPYFLYYDRAVVRKINDMDSAEDITSSIIYPDPRKPELMDDPVPVFIDVSDCEKLQDTYLYSEDAYVIAFAVEGGNVSNVLEFLDYLME